MGLNHEGLGATSSFEERGWQSSFASGATDSVPARPATVASPNRENIFPARGTRVYALPTGSDGEVHASVTPPPVLGNAESVSRTSAVPAAMPSPTHEVDKKSSFPFTLTSNEVVDHIAATLRITQPQWDQVLGQVDEQGRAGEEHSIVAGLAAEFHVQNVVRDIATSKEFADKIALRPSVLDNENTRDLFRKEREGSLATIIYGAKGHAQALAEYDFFIEAGEQDKLPVVGEVRVTGKRDRARNRGVKALFRDVGIRHKINPLHKVYGAEPSKFGFIIVSVPDIIVPEYRSGQYIEKSDTQLSSKRAVEAQYLRRGGILVTFPFGLEEINDKVEEFKSKHPR